MFSTFSVTVFFCFVVRVANVLANHDHLCDNVDCGENGMCEVISRPRPPDKAKCKCRDGFTGRRCQVEVMINHRCYFRPNSPTESNQITGIGKCPDPAGQFCLPDNFYCAMYGCNDSIGWCIKTAVMTSAQCNGKQQPQKDQKQEATTTERPPTTTTMIRRGTNPELTESTLTESENTQEDKFVDKYSNSSTVPLLFQLSWILYCYFCVCCYYFKSFL